MNNKSKYNKLKCNKIKKIKKEKNANKDFIID